MTLDFRSTVVFVSVFVTTTVALDEPSDPKPFLRGSLSFRPRLRGSRPRSRPAAPDAAPPRGRGSDALCGGAVDRSFAGDVQGKGGDRIPAPHVRDNRLGINDPPGGID